MHYPKEGSTIENLFQFAPFTKIQKWKYREFKWKKERLFVLTMIP